MCGYDFCVHVDLCGFGCVAVSVLVCMHVDLCGFGCVAVSVLVGMHVDLGMWLCLCVHAELCGFGCVGVYFERTWVCVGLGVWL